LKPSEQSVAAVVVAYLEAMGADVYQEVTCATGVADIVARVGAELWIVEVKTQASISVLVQAMDRRRSAHRVFVAVPVSRTLPEFVQLAEEIGIGVLEVTTGDPEARHAYNQPRVVTKVSSRRWNARPCALAAKLRPEHKTHAKAGAVGSGGRWTPFRDTCEQLARAVAREPGVTVKDAIESIAHHYSSNAGARGSLVKWIDEGKVAGVERRGRQLFPANVPKAEVVAFCQEMAADD
jgi:hypothetical protein